MQQTILDYYNRLASNYDQDRFGNSYGQFLHQQEDKILQKWGVTHLDAPTLSLGCGTGRFMEYATHGSDLSPAMIEQAKHGFPDKSFTVADADKLPFETGFFDLSFSLHLFMHLDKEKVRAILKEQHRVLKPGGHFIFDVPSARRRRLTNHQQNGWHGANAYTYQDLRATMGDQWQISATSGVLFLPIHRLPNQWRQRFSLIDRWLCNSPIWTYSSYWLVNAQRL